MLENLPPERQAAYNEVLKEFVASAARFMVLTLGMALALNIASSENGHFEAGPIVAIWIISSTLSTGYGVYRGVQIVEAVEKSEK